MCIRAALQCWCYFDGSGSSHAKPGGLQLKFTAYDGDLTNKKKMTFQVNVAGLRAEFLQIGEIVAGTKLRLHDFRFKEAKVPGTDKKVDVSELILREAGTDREIVAPLGKPVPLPASAQ